MSRQRVSAGSGKRVQVGYLVAGIATGLVLLWLAYALVLTIGVTIDGKPRRVMRGTLVSDLYAKKLVEGDRGDLVAVKDHRVLRRDQGEKPYVLIDGKRAPMDARLQGADVIESKDGTDVVEPLVKRTEPMAAPVRYQGSGSLESVIASGKPGVRELTVGQLSKQVVSTRIITQPQARVVQRRAPDGRAKIVALTFDDGPWPGQTEAVLKILQRYGIKATFFQIGVQAKGRPGISKMLAEAGMQLANHSQTHPNLAKQSAARVARELEQASANIEKASGQRPKYFRPPGGNMSSAVRAQIDKMGLTLVQWDVDTTDWRKPGVTTIVNKVVFNVEPGSVVLMHDGGGDRSQTIKALPTIIEKLKAMGYEFVTLDGLKTYPNRLG